MEKNIKILPISDLHGKHNEIFEYILDNIDVVDYDIVTASGDLWEGTSNTPRTDWINFQKIIKKPIILIQGNHDYFSSDMFDKCDNIHLLHNESIIINGVKIFGTPYTTNFMDWNWMSSEDKLFEMWNKLVPNDTDVLLSHGPPYGFCDNCNQSAYGNTKYSKLGSKALLEILLDKSPKYLFCGHIHTGDRFKQVENGTKIYNVSCLDEAYQFQGFNPPPKVVELEL